MTVAAPELHVGRLRVANVAESRMAVVARTRQHGETAVDLAGEQHAVAVEGDKHMRARLRKAPEWPWKNFKPLQAA